MYRTRYEARPYISVHMGATKRSEREPLGVVAKLAPLSLAFRGMVERVILGIQTSSA